MEDCYIWITTERSCWMIFFLSKSLFLTIRKDTVSLLELGMATGNIRVDINFVDPHPRATTCARAHNSPRVENEAYTRYPRIPTCPQARLCTLMLRKADQICKPDWACTHAPSLCTGSERRMAGHGSAEAAALGGAALGNWKHGYGRCARQRDWGRRRRAGAGRSSSTRNWGRRHGGAEPEQGRGAGGRR